MVSSVKSGILGPGAVFKIQLWNLGSGHPFSGVNSGIFGPCTCFQESTPESRASDLLLSRPGFRSQLWNLGCGHPFSGVNSGILGPGPGFRSQLWNFGLGHPSSAINSGILGWGTRFQESTLESWVQDLVSGVNSGVLGWGTRFQESAPVLKVNSGILGSGTRFQESNLESWDLVSGVNSGILGPGPGFTLEFWAGTRFQESTLESSVRAPVFRNQLCNLRCGHLFAGINFECWVRAPVFRSRFWNLGSGHLLSGSTLNLWFGTCFQDSTLESWVRAPVFRSQLWNLGSRTLFFKNQLWSFRTGTSFQESAPVSKVNSGILDWGTRFQESTLEFLVRHLLSGTNWLTLVSRVWAPVSGSDSGFQESAPGILVGHLFSGVNSGILGPGTWCCWESTLGSWVEALFWCGQFAFRSRFWRLWNHRLESGTLCWAGCFFSVGFTCFQKSAAPVSNGIFASALVLMNRLVEFWVQPVFKAILGWGTCFQESTLESWVGAPALESWVWAPVFKGQLWNHGWTRFLGGSICYNFSCLLPPSTLFLIWFLTLTLPPQCWVRDFAQVFFLRRWAAFILSGWLLNILMQMVLAHWFSVCSSAKPSSSLSLSQSICLLTLCFAPIFSWPDSRISLPYVHPILLELVPQVFPNLFLYPENT